MLYGFAPEMDYIGYIPILDDILIEKLGIN